MSSHLSSQQVAEWVGGKRNRKAETHLRDCPACQAEINHFEATLGQFRSSLREWSAEQFNPNVLIGTDWQKSQPKTTLPKLGWALLLLAVYLAASLLLHRSETHQPIVVRVATISDSALLKQVDQDVSRTVPSPMEPLVNLVSWDGSSSQGTENNGQ